MTSPRAYYNECEPQTAAWLRELISRGHLPAGDVDERSVADVDASDLRGYAQCHFFAGIGGWPYALRLAGWPDDESVWTGSPPCQVVSTAARGRNSAADRWPEYRQLVATGRPRVVFGEQVADAGWIARARDDLEALGYAFGCAALPAFAVGQDHARPRAYFAGYANGDSQSSVPLNAEARWLPRPDGQRGRNAQAHGLSARMVKRGYGNAIVPQLAAEFVTAFCEALSAAGVDHSPRSAKRGGGVAAEAPAHNPNRRSTAPCRT